MSNSQVITHDFDYYSPKTIEEALQITKDDIISALNGLPEQ